MTFGSESRRPLCLIEHGITFDWTGEPKSLYNACVTVPESWGDRDERGAFEGLGEVFKGLIALKGFVGGVEGVLGLVYGEDGGGEG